VSLVEVPVGLLAAILAASPYFLISGATGPGAREAIAAVQILASLASVILGFIGQQLATAAVVKTVSEAYLGREATVGQAYGFILRKGFRLLLAALAVGLITGLGFMLCIVPGIIFGLQYVFTVTAIVLEDQKVFSGMGRSKQLGRGNLGKIFLVLLVVGLITFVAAVSFQWGGMAVSLLAFPNNRMAATFLVAVLQVIPQVLIMPFSAAATVLLYYDLRIRKEGFDLEMLAMSMGSQGNVPDEPQTA